jgi:hypothetical protein
MLLHRSRVIWLGDLNYRIALSYCSAKALVEMHSWKQLLEKDQVIRCERVCVFFVSIYFSSFFCLKCTLASYQILKALLFSCFRSGGLKNLFLADGKPLSLPLLKLKQLRMQQRYGRVFQGWKEGRIYFPPTYKYSFNSDRYAGEGRHPKEKRRTPAW